ncbi:DUF2779 domain-containing protein [Alteromonas lipolytica]|uniref:DUF2779 domain-containing protein n=1 Tax=Alteromonas lipolytica TaxID=1856405 RepID=A0A1E8FA50_9ALTE|nr:DUF2779 domain-containing protein [Alteromonas lipolytica]OFI32790.1 hypothetical protein BFC17_06485 [Alteromonas lipolytica]GGF72974.1 hypothetical protein GCM10011338_26470 [Alteromonas lipolytica]
MRYLTKSRFKLATECPTKLFYTNKKEYVNKSLDDPFMEALAEGGYQVGELAKCAYPGGIEVGSLDYEQALAKTNELLAQDSVVIFEAAVKFENLFIRVDILVKQGNHFELIEVKAKSYSAVKDKDFLNTSGKVDSKWKPYIFDAAFQRYVVKHAYPQSSVDTYLMLVDKSATCPTNGLNQKFQIVRDARSRKGIQVSNSLTNDDLATPLLTRVNVNNAIQVALDNDLQHGFPAHSFEQNILALADHYERDEKIAPVIGKKCKNCEFHLPINDITEQKRSGFHECWKEQLHWDDADFDEPTVLDIWSFRKADSLINDGVIKVADLTKEMIGLAESPEPALNTTERQWLQIEKIQNKDPSIHIDEDSLKAEMASWTYPLHFIDFETSAVAIPFFAGMAPYQGIAFQFSHHKVYEDGRVEHAGEFLSTTPGEFPNFEFVRELKAQLEPDNGTIFRYSNHENSYLNMLHDQLESSSEPDAAELQAFIESITHSSSSSSKNWSGERDMVDLWVLVKKYFYDPAMKGSNSIKAVLPAILNSSEYLQRKYSSPVYGSDEIPSHNFSQHAWVQFTSDGKVADPYKSLPKLFSDVPEDVEELISDADELNNGGLAQTAYAKMQFTQMSDYERDELRNGLLKYCELDTLAMVMIFEGWREMIR